jgi:hypothetical protein
MKDNGETINKGINPKGYGIVGNTGYCLFGFCIYGAGISANLLFLAGIDEPINTPGKF